MYGRSQDEGGRSVRVSPTTDAHGTSGPSTPEASLCGRRRGRSGSRFATSSLGCGVSLVLVGGVVYHRGHPGTRPRPVPLRSERLYPSGFHRGGVSCPGAILG